MLEDGRKLDHRLANQAVGSMVIWTLVFATFAMILCGVFLR